MRLSSSVEENRAQNAVICVTPHPDPSVDPGPLAGLLPDDDLLVVQNAIINDVENKMRIWSDYATCFFAVDRPAETQVRPVSVTYESLELRSRESGYPFATRIMPVIEQLWEREFRRIVLLAGMAPTLPVDVMRDAFEWLIEKDVVLGPTDPGGCYILGIRDIEAPFLPTGALSDPHTFGQVFEGVAKGGYTLQTLEFWPTLERPVDLVNMYLHLSAMLSSHIQSGSAEKYNVFSAIRGLVQGDGILEDERFRTTWEQARHGATASDDGTVAGDGNAAAAPADAGASASASGSDAQAERPDGSRAPAAPYPGGAPAPLPGQVRTRPAGGPRSAVSNAGRDGTRADDVG